MDITLSPQESGDFIAAEATDVKIDLGKCKEVAVMIMDDCVSGKIDDVEYKANPLHPAGLSDEDHLNWVFVLDTLNFSFWPDEGKTYDVTYNDKKETGYLACCAAFMKAHAAGTPITSATWMANVHPQDLDDLLRDDEGNSIPMIDERVRALHESGDFLLKKHDGQYLTMVKKFASSAQTLLRAILMIESFRDMTMYHEKRVSMLKRAQILIADTWGILKDSQQHAGLVDWPDLDSLTMFADYRVPQALNFLGCFDYSERVLAALHSNTLLKYGDPLEVQLRGCSIFCVDEIYHQIVKMRTARYKDIQWQHERRRILPIDIDVWLWQFRREHAAEVEAFVPFHRTRSIYY